MVARDDEFALTLGPLARAILRERGCTRSGLRGDKSSLTALAHECGHAPHDAAIAFENDYGGIEFYEGETDKPPGAPSLLVGPYACMKAGYSGKGGADNEDEHLVLAILAWDDVSYFIGRDGRGWSQSFLDAKARQSAHGARQLLTQAILWRKLALLAQRFGMMGGDGAIGAELAAKYGLEPIEDASGRDEQWWGTVEALVVQVAQGNGYMDPMTYAVVTPR